MLCGRVRGSVLEGVFECVLGGAPIHVGQSFPSEEGSLDNWKSAFWARCKKVNARFHATWLTG